MTCLRHPDGRVLVLSPYCVAGRSPEAQARLTSSAVSSEHAAFHRIGETWYLRDLGSRNGTFLNGDSLEQGKRVPLEHGDRLRFGDAREEWRFERNGDGSDAEHPVLLETSSLQPRTALDRVALRLAVSPDARDVSIELAILGEDHRQSLGSRAGFHLLLFLARARLEDRDRAIALAEEGWRSRDAVLEALEMTKNRLSVESHRLRHLFEQHGVRDASSLLELRRGSSTLRLGVEHLAIDE